MEGQFCGPIRWNLPKIRDLDLGRRQISTNCDIPVNHTKGTLTRDLFAFTIQNMMYACVHNAGFFRPDHDPPY